MMPKFSVYVPDELWDSARAAEPHLNPSQLMQTALRRFVGEATARPVFTRERPADSRAQVAAVRAQLAQRARERYEAGYQQGLALATTLPWEALDQLAELEWDLTRWDEERDEDEDPEPYASLLEQALTPAYRREATYRTGVGDALQDVWQAVTSLDGDTTLHDAEEDEEALPE